MNEETKQKLSFNDKNASEFLSGQDEKEADEYSRGYIAFLNSAKTERETVQEALKLATAGGFKPYQGGKLSSGDRVYLNHHNKALILVSGGSRPLREGISFAASHIDSPRLDLKSRPLYEDGGLAYFDTHYYGGIKAYQWTSIPLALHGTVIRKDGTALTVRIGEDPADPVFFISDLLPHLASAQMQRKAEDIVKSEDLNILIGVRGFPGEKGEGSVKLNILSLLSKQYGITEEDLVSAELEAVPAFPARHLGLDMSMIGAYGHDDRVCAYPALTALLDQKTPEYTAAVILADKEETGSFGYTGMQGAYLRDFIRELADNSGEKEYRVLANSICLSGDVISAYDPIYADVFDRRNASALNRGVVISKYRGARGKLNTVDASAELVALVRKILNDGGILWQTGEGGKVDAGGGSTLGKFIANLNVPTIDLGVPLLSMHSPFEVIAKTDLLMAYKSFGCFFKRGSA